MGVKKLVSRETVCIPLSGLYTRYWAISEGDTQFSDNLYYTVSQYTVWSKINYRFPAEYMAALHYYCTEEASGPPCINLYVC